MSSTLIINEYLQKIRAFTNTANELKVISQSLDHIDVIKNLFIDIKDLLENLIELVSLAENGKQLLCENKDLLLKIKDLISKGSFVGLESEVEKLQKLFGELWFSAFLSILRADISNIAKISSYPNIHQLSKSIRETFDSPAKSLEKLKNHVDIFWQTISKVDRDLGSHILSVIVKRLFTYSDLSVFIKKDFNKLEENFNRLSSIIEDLLKHQVSFMKEVEDIPKGCDGFNSSIIRFLCSKLQKKKEDLAASFDINYLKNDILAKDDIDSIIGELNNLQGKLKTLCENMRKYKENIQDRIIKLFENVNLKPPYYKSLEQWLKDVDEILTKEFKLSKIEDQILEITIECAELNKPSSIDIIVDRLRDMYLLTEILEGIYNLCKRGILECQLRL